MVTAIAFCTDAADFQKNQILDENIAKRYPGALWVVRLSQFSKERAIEMVTGDVAIANIRGGNWRPSDILVVQEESSSHGFELLRMGANPLVVTCLESPLYARDFYARLPEISSLFRNRVLFRGAFEHVSPGGRNHVLYFPSFSLHSRKEIVPWRLRKFLVMIAANKYWNHRRPVFRKLIAWIRDTVRGRKSRVTKVLIDQQLHDRRLTLIEYFGQKGVLDLYGPHWGDISNLPMSWRRRLERIIDGLSPVACPEKYEASSRYKFAICFENVSFPGYVTEKIIDCFTAGVIPVYLGAPDIADFIPKNSFVDIRDFASLDDLHEHLRGITEDVALDMIHAGQSFLRSKEGAEYSYEGFARNVLQMVTGYR